MQPAIKSKLVSRAQQERVLSFARRLHEELNLGTLSCEQHALRLGHTMDKPPLTRALPASLGFDSLAALVLHSPPIGNGFSVPTRIRFDSDRGHVE